MAATRVLNDRYEVEATLGEGGMARVFRGTDRVLGRTVAIKVLAGKYAGDDSFVARFRREAQAAAGLNHPNIVGVYDTGDHGDMHYIVMEYVEGDTLADVLRRDGPMNPDRASVVAGEVATALQAAHDTGLVHRDVKPGNVMIDDENRVKVMDFGIARAAADDTLTQTGVVLGTASYLSPEQAQGLPVDARSDIYSLGCVLYEMLTGRPPFVGDTPVSIAYKHVNEEPRPPSELNPSVPAHLDAAVRRSLAKDPHDRFPSADAFRAALAGGQAGTATVPIAAAGGDTEVLPPTAPAPEPAPQPRERSWVPMALIAAAILALAGILVLTLAGPDERAGRRERQEQQEQPPAEEPTTPAAPSVEQSLGALEDLVIEAVETEQLSTEAGQKILENAQAAAATYFGGGLEGALEELGKAHEETDKALEEGQVTSVEVAETINGAIDVVAQAMEASPPATVTPEEEEESDEGFIPPGQEKKDDQGKGKDD